ncbi:hypothetical protein K435DRAFT_95266 [Dendrothele bispora CBS 962.96]|uniref:Uncharacterized protein n=1 Tax=Dendrothele bispora (strain CBS 962.96) TaxID=1314807 RepID=A0A4S8M3B7_DENBC|nr:hypothetical protein K435DRAFT_95266 [Dendrothele bispora CBS 962.96]
MSFKIRSPENVVPHAIPSNATDRLETLSGKQLKLRRGRRPEKSCGYPSRPVSFDKVSSGTQQETIGFGRVGSSSIGPACIIEWMYVADGKWGLSDSPEAGWSFRRWIMCTM